jgi:hypothetical protein
MPPVLAVLFWIWLAVSVVVLLRRRADRRAKRAVAAESLAAEELTSDAVEARTARPVPDAAADTAPAESSRVPAMAAGTGASAAATPGPVATGPTAPTPPPGFEEPLAPVVERHAHRDAPAAGIADALVGIRMPCDLVPLVVDRLATDKVVLSTTGFPAEVVGSSLADEVERLGYVVRPLGDREVIATRGATELRMAFKGAGANGRHHDHPTARDDSVVVEITLS